MTDKTDREIMQMALEALEVVTDTYDDNAVGIEIDAIIALRKRLARPEQEPVAWMYEWDNKKHLTFTDQSFVEKAHPHFNKSTPLYTAPQKREWQRVTDQELHEMEGYEEDRKLYRFARAVEAKLKEKND